MCIGSAFIFGLKVIFTSLNAALKSISAFVSWHIKSIRLLKALGINLSVDKAMNIAKTVSTIKIKLANGTTAEQTILTTDEQNLLASLINISS